MQSLTGLSWFLHPCQLFSLSNGIHLRRQAGWQPGGLTIYTAIAFELTNSFIIALEQQLQEND